tara:strand:+ start:876 stop:1463 length:588 start_codon:yes stop_codon:yes gene_type:complete
MAALPWVEVPEFVDTLAKQTSTSARTLELIILTAVRSGEARGARWTEFDFAGRAWTIPAERMKRGVPHRVPLSEEAIKVLGKVRGLDSEFVFPSASQSKDGQSRVQSDMVFTSLYKRMGRSGFTTHGFRSSFRDWCSECVHADREIAEAALSHATGSAVERAYARSDLFDRRRKLMDQWGKYVSGEAGNVVSMVG